MTIIRNHIATSLSIQLEDLDYPPSTKKAAMGGPINSSATSLPELLEELNETLAA